MGHTRGTWAGALRDHRHHHHDHQRQQQQPSRHWQRQRQHRHHRCGYIQYRSEQDDDIAILCTSREPTAARTHAAATADSGGGESGNTDAAVARARA